MNIIQIGILIFIFIESLNVMMLYFSPGQKMGNGVGVFNAWHKAQEDDEIKDFVKYMTSWVANTKLIFILVGAVVIIWGSYFVQLATAAVLALSITAYFISLHPIIKRLDEQDKITPKGYSKTLAYMIIGFIVVFVTVFVVGLIQYL